MVEVSSDAYHVFTVSIGFFWLIRVYWLVNTLLEMVQDRVSRCFANGCVEKGGVWGVEREG